MYVRWCVYLFAYLSVVEVIGEPFFITVNKADDDESAPFHNKLVRNKTSGEIEAERTQDFWKKNGVNAVKERLARKLNLNIAKNVIFFLGDGMSIPTIAATRVYLGGEEQQLSFEKFPYTGLSKTYCVDHQTPDSACSATSYMTGVKSNLGTIGVTAAVNRKNCSAMNIPENRVDSVVKLFQQQGKNTGIVTTTRVTHASPAAVYSHTAYRHWESDTDVLDNDNDPSTCEDIAHQLIFGDVGRNLKVIFGGGRKKLLPKEIKDDGGELGERSDHSNLIEEWTRQKKALGVKAEYVSNRRQLLSIRNDSEYVLGLFRSSHMSFNTDRNPQEEPSLLEMTESAIKILGKGDKGFFLFVEGGRIDMAHHRTLPHKALDETAEFSKAVQRAVEMTREDDTLIVVTSDHAHTMSYSGHAQRGSEVFGYAGKATDSNLYTILSYANGPGYRPLGKDGKRYVPSVKEMNDINFQWPSTSPMRSETHGADDVGIFARGPWAHLFTGVMEENVIPHLVAYAACVSKDIDCRSYRKEIS